MKIKYIIANINLPLQVNDDGTYIVMNDNIEIKFENYEGILVANDECKKNACEELSKLISEIFVDKSELSRHKTNRRNMTFKNVKSHVSSISKYSVKKKISEN